jgi:hypothetical protein
MNNIARTGLDLTREVKIVPVVSAIRDYNTAEEVVTNK